MKSFFSGALCLALAGGLLAGCALDYHENRAYLPPYKWAEVEALYQQSGSIDIVRRELEDRSWYASDINEAVYRLRKKYEVDVGAETRMPQNQEKQGLF